MACNPKCKPPYVCKSFDGKSWCQKNKGKLKGNTGMDVKRATGKLKKAGMKGVTKGLGMFRGVVNNPSKNKKRTLKRTKEMKNMKSYKLKF